MAVEIQKEEGGILVMSVSGMFTKADLEKCQDASIQVIETTGSMKALIVLSNFQGWAKSGVWEDVTFTSTFGEKMEKIAFVGDPKWRDEMFMFTGKGIRKTEIEFFEESAETEARGWLRKPC